jgi:hypothetical protein
MVADTNRDSLIERRHRASNDTPQNKDCWDSLTLAQHFSASSLTSYGYKLSFIRHSEAGSLAVLFKYDQITTITENGDINTHPNIYTRT